MKDRVAVTIIEEVSTLVMSARFPSGQVLLGSLSDLRIRQALESGKLVRGGVVTEGSAGSTAISLATVAPAYRCKCHVVIPDDVAIEKVCIAQHKLLFYCVMCHRCPVQPI